MKTYPLALIVLFLFTSLTIGSDQLGSIDFPNSGSAEAQKEFLRGVLLLHSFEYADARANFKKAQEIDPSFAMAYWGEAMTHNHPIWNERDREQAIASLNRLAPTPPARLQKAKTPKEKEFLTAVEILFESGEKKERDLAYSQAMEKIYRKYPEDLEVASFYALALLGSCQNVREFPVYMKAAAIVEEVFAKNSQHPGAAHYLIHSYDDPIHASLGLRAARVYAKIAPAAVHALHMPSHIFLALGMWDEVESSNEVSWKTSKEKSYHALHWLQYSYLQQGRFQEARKLLDKITADAKSETDQYGRARWHLAAMRSGYVIESQSRYSDVASSPVKPESDSLTVDVADIFAAAWSAVREKRIDDALKHQSEIHKALSLEGDSAKEGAHCSPAFISKKGQDKVSPESKVSPAELQAAQIMKKELQALILVAQGKKEEGIRLLKEATALEDSMTFEFGPPMPVKPSHELLGEILLEAGKFAEAQMEFEKALARAPRRTLSMAGLAKAAAKAGDTQVAREAQTELQNIRRKADAP